MFLLSTWFNKVQRDIPISECEKWRKGILGSTPLSLRKSPEISYQSLHPTVPNLVSNLNERRQGHSVCKWNVYLTISELSVRKRRCTSSTIYRAIQFSSSFSCSYSVFQPLGFILISFNYLYFLDSSCRSCCSLSKNSSVYYYQFLLLVASENYLNYSISQGTTEDFLTYDWFIFVGTFIQKILIIHVFPFQ